MKKKYKSRILTFLIASALTATAVGGASLAFNKTSAATYSPTRIFTASSSASVKSDGEDVVFTLKKDGDVSFKRDLALKWFAKDAEGSAAAAKYLSMKFAFRTTEFTNIDLTFETAPSTSLKDNKAVNKVVFEASDGKISVGVNDSETRTEFTATEEFELTLAEGFGSETAGEGEFFVLLNGEKVGVFEKVGANFAEHTSSTVPFSFKANFAEDATDASAEIVFKELNGQAFRLEDGQIKDTAKPVLVVNDDVMSFMLGMPFTLDYEVIDVLDTSVSKEMTYYQYNPEDTEVKYNTLSTSTYFYDTVYTVGEGESAKKTTVYAEEGMEFVSVKFKLSDADHKGDDAEEYLLSWYAAETVKPTKTALTGDFDMDYIRVDRNEEGPAYTCIENVEVNGVMVTRRTAEAEAVFASYQERVTEAAEKVSAGSNSYIYLPSLKGIIADNDTGYKTMKFNLYYKTESSDNLSSTSLSYENLKLAVSSVGLYEFKVTAVDRANNAMYFYEDGHKVQISSDNIWDIEAIPSFTFSVADSDLSVEENSDSTDTGYIGVTYTASDFTVTGVGDPSKEYGLYFLDRELFRAKFDRSLSKSDISSIEFSELKDMAAADDSADKADRLKEDALGYFAELYAKALSERVGRSVTADALLKPDADGKVILRKIEEYDSTIDKDKHPTEWKNSDNEYQWYPSSRSFKPQKEGYYMVLAVITDSELFGEKVCAYRTVSVEADSDVITGETEWLKNNIASIILFSIAGVMLILIIILLFVKPSDESLEDVDDGKKSEKDKKKSRKNKSEKKDK